MFIMKTIVSWILNFNLFNSFNFLLTKQFFHLVFTTLPPPFYKRNNLSARQEISFVREEVASLLTSGIIAKCESCPYIVSPLTVAVRTCCLTNKTKKR